jgi:hypothetical protein
VLAQRKRQFDGFLEALYRDLRDRKKRITKPKDVQRATEATEAVSTAVKGYQDVVETELQQVKKAKTPRAIADAAETVNRQTSELDQDLRRADSELRTVQTSAEQIRKRFPEHEQFKQMVNRMRDYVNQVYAGQQRYSEQFPDLVATVVMPPAKRQALALHDAPRPSAAASSSAASSSGPVIEELVPVTPGGQHAIPETPGPAVAATPGAPTGAPSEGVSPQTKAQVTLNFDELYSLVDDAPKLKAILDKHAKNDGTRDVTVQNVVRWLAANLIQHHSLHPEAPLWKMNDKGGRDGLHMVRSRRKLAESFGYAVPEGVWKEALKVFRTGVAEAVYNDIPRVAKDDKGVARAAFGDLEQRALRIGRLRPKQQRETGQTPRARGSK